MVCRLSIVGVIATAFLCSPLQAGTITWANWSPTFKVGAPDGGSATATLGTTSVSYSGELRALVFNYPSWGPAKTYTGGTVNNAPPPSGGMIRIHGGHKGVNTLKFAVPVADPVLAIWSLGSPGIPASFVFSQPFSIQSGGPTNEYGGSSITTSDNLVVNAIQEGNGTIQFVGVFTELSWVNPQTEDWYGFTVGVGDAFVSERKIQRSFKCSKCNGLENCFPSEKQCLLAAAAKRRQVYLSAPDGVYLNATSVENVSGTASFSSDIAIASCATHSFHLGCRPASILYAASHAS